MLTKLHLLNESMPDRALSFWALVLSVSFVDASGLKFSLIWVLKASEFGHGCELASIVLYVVCFSGRLLL